MKCIKCGSELSGPKLLELQGEIRNQQVSVSMDAFECVACGHRTIRGVQMEEFMRLSADAYRRKNELLTSDELRAARAKLKMSQQAFAAYLDVSSASVKRWELGDIQTPAMDQLVRFKTDIGFAETMLAELVRRVAISMAARLKSSPARRTRDLRLSPQQREKQAVLSKQRSSVKEGLCEIAA